MKEFVILTFCFVFLFACSGSKKETEETTDALDLVIEEKLSMTGFAPLKAATVSFNDPKVKLGHALYYDKRLSKTGNNSCNSCHNLATFGVDNLPFSPGDAGKNGDRNSPTTLNAALHRMQFWDGRAKDVEEQAGMPILNPVEMAIPSRIFLENRLNALPYYQNLFKMAFPEDKNPVSYVNLQNAIGAFERTLITPSRFDSYLQGDKKALSESEKNGMISFILIGCTTCHGGELLGGTQLQKFGVHANYWEYTKSEKIDKGAFTLNKDTTKLYQFKVPSLRNISKTYPYFHDGSVNDLAESVKIMAKVQLNYDISSEETANIVAFMKALEGKVPVEAIKPPVGL
jgi:cytochrome c peroxidase